MWNSQLFTIILRASPSVRQIPWNMDCRAPKPEILGQSPGRILKEDIPEMYKMHVTQMSSGFPASRGPPSLFSLPVPLYGKYVPWLLHRLPRWFGPVCLADFKVVLAFSNLLAPDSQGECSSHYIMVFLSGWHPWHKQGWYRLFS
jgi:hypothetical protein